MSAPFHLYLCGRIAAEWLIFMVKGTSRQVIVVHSPDQKLFDQAIFILKDGAVGTEGVTDEALLKEARQLAAAPRRSRGAWRFSGPIWACGGAAITGIVWILTMIW